MGVHALLFLCVCASTESKSVRIYIYICILVYVCVYLRMCCAFKCGWMYVHTYAHVCVCVVYVVARGHKSKKSKWMAERRDGRMNGSRMQRAADCCMTVDPTALSLPTHCGRVGNCSCKPRISNQYEICKLFGC